jgi:methylenetetrahydrofolate dehydrogenase (NADP+)/methenyltetrahydrofolate cyclohydrolase
VTHGTETPNEEEDRTIAQVIDGKAFAATLCEGITHYILRLKEKHGITPDLAVVLVG